MIIKASQRGGGRKLAAHLMNDRDNEHVELHEVRGFVSGDLHGAFLEVEAAAKGTKCKQHFFSVSLSRPETENVRPEVFELAARRIKDEMGLQRQPRALVFHEKDGRRHADAVWSRIDTDNMRAINLPHFKRKLNEISRGLFLEHGWNLPDGYKRGKDRPSVLSTALEQTAFLASPAMMRGLGRSTFDIAALKNNDTGLTVYLYLPARRLRTHSRFLRLLLMVALARMEAVPNVSETQATVNGWPLLFMLDEFPVLGHMDVIESAAGLMAGYGVKLWTVLHDLSQL